MAFGLVVGVELRGKIKQRQVNETLDTGVHSGPYLRKELPMRHLLLSIVKSQQTSMSLKAASQYCPCL